MTCTVCGRPGGVVRLTARGDTYGTTCAGRCDALAWDMWWLRRTSAPAYEVALTAWEWRRHVAEVRGLVFTEVPPQSPPEAVLNTWIHANEFEPVAKELSP